MPRTNVTASVLDLTPVSRGVVLIAALAGVAATTAAGEPTGVGWWDGVLKFVFAVVIVLAGSKAPRWALIVIASIAAAAGGVSLWGVFGWAALLTAAASGLLVRRHRLISAVVAAVVAQTLLRLPAAGFFGLQSLFAFAAFSVVAIAGYRYGTRVARQLSRRLAIGVALLAIATLLVGGLAVLGARSDVDRGVAAARRGLESARAGDAGVVASELGIAEEAFSTARSRLSGPAARVLRFVPVAAQHQRAIETATSQGALVTRQAAATIEIANIDEISLAAGSVDLGSLQLMAPQLSQTVDALKVAKQTLGSIDSPWLLPVVQDRVSELSEEIEALLPETEIAAVATSVVPAMLGIDGPQTYFVLFGTPAESRGLGGFIGSWALVTFTDGQLSLGESGRINELYDVAAAGSVAPGTVSDWYLEMARPTQFPQNLSSSPDFHQVAEVSRQVLGGVSSQPLAGFMYLDALAFVDMLELTGPIQIPFQDEPLTAASAPEFFFADQYRLEGVSRTQLFDTLAEVAGTVVQRVTEQTLPGPEELGRVLGPAARAGHLQMVTFDDAHNDFLRSVQLLREFDQGDASDFVALVQSNALSNKMDLYLERALSYDVTIDDDGVLNATATARLRSVVPADAPDFTLGRGETIGVNRLLLSLYSPHVLTGVRLDGVPVEFRATEEFGFGRYLVDISVPPNVAPIEVSFDLVGAVRDEPYSVKVWQQALVNADTFSISFVSPEETFSWSGPLNEAIVLDVASGQ